jgi:hypothetical protein
MISADFVPESVLYRPKALKEQSREFGTAKAVNGFWFPQQALETAVSSKREWA